MATLNSFTELDCWKMANGLRQAVSRLVRTFPSEEKYALISQMRRSSRSVTDNIAEGFGHHSDKENLRFCRIARGSLFELENQCLTSSDEGYLNSRELNELLSDVENTKRILNGYIRYLENRSTDYSREPEQLYGLRNATTEDLVLVCDQQQYYGT